MNSIEQSDTLNTLLSLVYDLSDASEGVSKDLDKIISQVVQQVEALVDENDKLLGDLK